MSTRKNALKFVVEKKKDGFVNQLLFFKPCRCRMHVSRCVERSREKNLVIIVVSPQVSLMKDQFSLCSVFSGHKCHTAKQGNVRRG